MNPVPKDKVLFKAIVRPNPKATKVLFYLTSYAFPWWAYKVPVERLRKLGYEVIVYDFDDAVIENVDPSILPRTILKLSDDMYEKQEFYQAKGIKIFHGIGNSLGSFMLFNYALRHKLNAIILNSGGSVADIIFGGKQGTWKQVAEAYTRKGYEREKLRALWADYDEPSLGKGIKADRVLLQYSLKDGTIPLVSTQGFVKGLQSSDKLIILETNNLPHVKAVLRNSLRVRHLFKFLNGNLGNLG